MPFQPDPPELDLTLARDARAPGHARGLVAVFPADLEQDRRADAVLAVSELVSNAVKHGRGEIALRVVADTGRLRVEVADEGRGRIAFREATVDPLEGGFGLRVVEAVTDRWGVEPGRPCVWFEIDTRTA
jgi:anti-sigma regulatory factor (Ser/Thr protein kinase)